MLRRRAGNLLDDLFEYNEFWMLKVNGSGGSAVVIASRGENDIIWKLEAIDCKCHAVVVWRFGGCHRFAWVIRMPSKRNHIIC